MYEVTICYLGMSNLYIYYEVTNCYLVMKYPYQPKADSIYTLREHKLLPRIEVYMHVYIYTSKQTSSARYCLRHWSSDIYIYYEVTICLLV